AGGKSILWLHRSGSSGHGEFHGRTDREHDACGASVRLADVLARHRRRRSGPRPGRTGAGQSRHSRQRPALHTHSRLFSQCDGHPSRRRTGRVCVDTQPAWYYKDGDALAKALGEDRLKHFIGLADWRKGGLKVAINSDHMHGIDPNKSLNPFNPFLAMYVAVTRRTESGRVIGPEQRVSREQALRMATIDAAYLSFDEKRKGSIEVGKFRPLASHGTPWRYSKTGHRCDPRRRGRSGDHNRARHRVF